MVPGRHFEHRRIPMNLRSIFLLAAATLFTACTPPAANTTNAPSNANSANTNSNTSKASDTKKSSTDLKQLAQRIVTQSAGVKEGDIVLVDGGARDMELLENIVVEVEKAGGQAMLTTESDALGKRSYDEVPDKYDSQAPKLGLALAKIANVSIAVDSQEAEAPLADVSPVRLAARAKAASPVNAEFIKNKVRQVAVGNDLYPTEWRAKRYDMPFDAFTKAFWDGVNVDYTDLQARGEQARKALAGKEIEITNPNGTSIKFNLQTRPAYISDGVISAEDIAAGNLSVFLPAGEAAVLAAPNSGTGKFVVDKDYFQGKEVHNLVLNFENGKLTSMTGEGDGFAGLKAAYDAGGDGKDLLSYVDFGINPNYVLPAGSKYGSWVSSGMVSLGSGNNTWAGGTNNSTGGAGGHLAGCTVTIDGKTVVDKGELKL
ncbi:MAG TPA: aminopeptidase [Pyrinomonadaceae bacterium]